MMYFKLKDDAFRGDFGTNTFFQTNNDLTDQYIIVVSIKEANRWSIMRQDDNRLDISDCLEITKKEWDKQFDEHIERNTF